MTRPESASPHPLPTGLGDQTRRGARPTLVKTRHHCQCRSFRYAAQFRCRTFSALSCCCFLAKALDNRKKASMYRKMRAPAAHITGPGTAGGRTRP